MLVVRNRWLMLLLLFVSRTAMGLQFQTVGSARPFAPSCSGAGCSAAAVRIETLACGLGLDDAGPAEIPSYSRPISQGAIIPFLTMVAAWALIFGAFVYHPEWISTWLRFMARSIEAVADQVPQPWGSRLEVMLKELGGMIWFQIASAIVLLRLMVWVPFHLWRLSRERRMR